MKSFLLGYLLILGLPAYALVPVEGLLLGTATPEYQQDPLSFIFNDIYDKSGPGENRKVKLYQSTVESGLLLKESCTIYQAPTYSYPWLEKQAKRSMAATLQYIGLDTSIKAIGTYAKKLDLGEEGYQKLTKNLVTNYCSKNLTVFSLKRIEQSLAYYYQNPQPNLIPSVESSPFATALYKAKTETPQARSNEFDQAIANFRSFCSWSGDVSDYRLMSPYLKSPVIMSFVIKNLMGVQDKYGEEIHSITLAPSADTVQVGCSDLICRKTSAEEFKKNFPRSVGSTGLYTDLTKLYCHHFKYQDYAVGNTLPEVKSWIKKMELEDPIFETSFFISLMTGVPDATFAVENYTDLPVVVRSSIDERWTKWSNDVLKSFSQNMLYEESIKIKAEPRRNKVALRTEGFGLDFSVTLGEMDRLTNDSDKLTLSFDLKLSKNYLRHLRSKWKDYSDNIDEAGRAQFKEEISKNIEVQLATKEKYFRQKMWNPEFSKLIVQELVGQVMAYKGPLFDSYQDQMLTIPVKFSYGVFALGYLSYRSDIKAGRLKLNL